MPHACSRCSLPCETLMVGLTTPSHERIPRCGAGFPGSAGVPPAAGRRPAIVHAGGTPALPRGRLQAYFHIKTRMAGLATPPHEKVRCHEGGFPGCAGFQPARAEGPQWTIRRRPAMVHAGWKPAHPGTLLFVCVFSRQRGARGARVRCARTDRDRAVFRYDGSEPHNMEASRHVHEARIVFRTHRRRRHDVHRDSRLGVQPPGPRRGPEVRDRALGAGCHSDPQARRTAGHRPRGREARIEAGHLGGAPGRRCRRHRHRLDMGLPAAARRAGTMRSRPIRSPSAGSWCGPIPESPIWPT